MAYDNRITALYERLSRDDDLQGESAARAARVESEAGAAQAESTAYDARVESAAGNARDESASQTARYTAYITPFKVGGTGVQSYSKTQPDELPTRLEAGTLNGHGIAGLSAAIDYINEVGLDEIDAREQHLMRRFKEGVSRIPGIKIYGDFDAPRTAVVCLNIRDLDSGRVSDALALEYGIATRPGAHCAPLMHRALGTVSQGAVRFSFSYFNTEEEIDAAISAVREIAENY